MLQDPRSQTARPARVENYFKHMAAGDIARLARPVFERYTIEKAILFGSFATGRQSRKSDVDLILIQRTQKRYFDRFDGLLRDLYRAIPGREIECFVYTPEELASISDRSFIRRALNEGTVIYEHG
jgi:predicted nucleotidyltransferase